MIGVINPNATETYDKQLSYAEAAEFQLAPGQPWPSETASSSSSSSSSPSKTATAAVSSTSHHSLAPGAIAGIAIGAAVVCLLAAALIYLFGRRGGMERAFRTNDNQHRDPLQQFSDGDSSHGGPMQQQQEAKFAAAAAADPFLQQQQSQQYIGGSMMVPHSAGGSMMYPGTSASPPPMSEYSASTTLGSYGQSLPFGSPWRRVALCSPVFCKWSSLPVLLWLDD